MAREGGPEISIRDFAPGDEVRILSMYERCFGHPMSGSDPRETWNWFYLRNPGGKLFIKLAESMGRLAAQYAVIPVRMKIGGWTGLGSLSLHTMTDPDFRGLGLFTSLAKALYSDLAAAGVPLTYGFPNSESVHGFVSKLGWTEPCPPPAHLFPLDPKRLLEARGKHWLVAGIGGAVARSLFRAPTSQPSLAAEETLEDLGEFGSEFDALWERASGGMDICAIRDRAFLTWRFTQKPGEKYQTIALRSGSRLEGYLVMKAGRIGPLSVVFIMDLLVAPPLEQRALILVSEALRRARESDADAVTCMLPPSHQAASALKRLKFLRLKPTQFPEEMHFGQRANGEVPGGAQPGAPASWYITWADSDVV